MPPGLISQSTAAPPATLPHHRKWLIHLPPILLATPRDTIIFSPTPPRFDTLQGSCPICLEDFVKKPVCTVVDESDDPENTLLRHRKNKSSEQLNSDQELRTFSDFADESVSSAQTSSTAASSRIPPPPGSLPGAAASSSEQPGSSSSSGAASSGVDEDDAHATLEDAYENVKLLSCGHAFHIDCIDSWEQSSALCPICKQPQAQTVDGEGNPLGEGNRAAGATAGTTSTTGGNNSAFSNSRGRGWNAGGALTATSVVGDLLDLEYRFRLGRLHSIYPEYVTSSMVSRWSSSEYAGNPLTDVDFIRSQPGMNPSGSPGTSGGSNWYSSSGGGGGFGGGSSFGGGGSGGSW